VNAGEGFFCPFASRYVASVNGITAPRRQADTLPYVVTEPPP